MAAKINRHFWWRCRIYFRRFRIAVWLVVLALLCALVYLDLVGLPDFVKRPLLDGLRSRGLDLEFSRLRWRWTQGIVANNVRFGRANETAGPKLRAKEVSLQLNLQALAAFHLFVDGLSLHEGTIEWPAAETGASLQVLNVSNIETRVSLGPGDQWSLDDFRARFAGANFTLSAIVTNASAIRDWKIFRTARPATTNAWPQRLRLLASSIEGLSFSTPPQLRLVLSGDARDPQSFDAHFSLDARDADTAWGKAAGVTFFARLLAGTTNTASRAESHLEVAAIQTRWGDVKKLRLTAHITATTNLPYADESLALWTNAMPWDVKWDCKLGALHSEKIYADNLVCAGAWLAPELMVTNFHASMVRGAVDAEVKLDVGSRAVRFNLSSDADPRDIEQLLTPKTRRWLSKFSWESAPHFHGSGAVILPEWTNRSPDWRGEVQPTLQLAGEFAVTNAAYLTVPADWAHSHLTYTNMVWHLPDLEVKRPEGVLKLVHEEDDRTKDYRWHVQGAIDPNAFRPLLKTNQLRAFDLVELKEPPVVEGDVWGRLYEYDRIGFQLHVAATNFSVRGQNASTFESDVRYTNRVLELIEPRLTRGAQHMSASAVVADFNAQRIYFTNGFSMAEPQAAAEAIGPKTAHTLEAYRFAIPPVVHVEGYAPLKGSTDADLHFAVDGGPFEWSKFKVPRITGDVHWLGKTLLLTNVQMEFYGGAGAGHAFFTFEPGKPGSDFNFSMTVSNANLQSLMAGVSTRSNRLEGLLSGSLLISDASSTNWHTWNGLGNVRLRDGFIWEIPVFGVFSPVLDGIIPGLGKSPATDGRAGFVITNGVIYSDSLNVRSPMMRLHYDGTVNFDGRINALVEAELLRDAGVVGRIIGAVLAPVTKLLEYKVTGTLSQPKPEPLHLPKFLFVPLHPIRTMEELLPGDSKGTNAPPANDLPAVEP